MYWYSRTERCVKVSRVQTRPISYTSLFTNTSDSSDRWHGELRAIRIGTEGEQCLQPNEARYYSSTKGIVLTVGHQEGRGDITAIL